MNKTALILGIGAGLMVAAGAASAAGSCSVEISAVEQAMAKDDGLNATGTPTELGVQTPSVQTPGASTGAPAATDIPSATTTGTQSAETGASTTIDPSSDAATITGTTSGTTSGTAAAPTVTETSRAGEMITSAGGHEAALASLAKAKNLAASGQEEACMTEVTAAKTALGLE